MAAPTKPLESEIARPEPGQSIDRLANDYLNVFSEILLLLEFLPAMPEMTDDALAWRPRGYCEYFEQSPLPGARDAAASLRSRLTRICACGSKRSSRG